MFAVFIFYLHRLVFKTVPRGFVRLRKSIEGLESTNEAHATESALILQRIEQKLDNHKRKPRPRKRTLPKARGK
jgi:hypothetical protein